MILDFEQTDIASAHACDIAIVGAGAVGLTMAVTLARGGANVLLIEGGGTALEMRSQALYDVHSIGRTLEGHRNGRFRLLGGTSNFWGGQLLRFPPHVLAARPWLGLEAWPISQEALEPHYARAMRLLNMHDCPKDEDVWETKRVPRLDLGEQLAFFFTRWLRNPNLVQLFGSDLNGGALKVLVHANVVGLEPDQRAARISRVRIRSLTGRDGYVDAKRVVLACATIEINRVLQLDYADGTHTPWQHNAWLGRGFVDHLDADAGRVKPLNRLLVHDLFESLVLGKHKFLPKIRLVAEAQKSAETLDIAGLFVFHSAYRDDLDNLKILVRAILNGRVPANVWRLPGYAASAWRVTIPLVLRYLRSRRISVAGDAGISFVLQCEQWPNPESRICLRPERDALGLPIVEMRWAIDGREMETMAFFAKAVRDAMKRHAVADIELDSRLLAGDPSFLTSANEGFHQMGGARMADTAAKGVVDPDLKVFGSENLYVAGAAVYPSAGFANPTLTAIALGQRLCEKLRATG